MNFSVSEILNSLTKDQRRQFYYLVGYAVHDGKSPRKKTDYKILVKSLNDEQKECLDWMIDEAIKESKKVKKNERSKR